MVTFAKCDNCGRDFKSPIQVSNLKTNKIQGNECSCPYCNKKTILNNENMYNS